MATKRQCQLGITREELERVLGDKLPVFDEWMDGQTAGICPEHGFVVYMWDLQRWAAGKPIVD